MSLDKEKKDMRLLRPIIRLSNGAGHLAEWLVVLMMGLILFEVFMRYVIQRPLRIADEFSAYMLAGISFLGTAYTWTKRGHVRITSLISSLPPRVASWVRLITLVVALIFSVLLSWAGYSYLAFSFRMGMKSATWLNVPLQWVQIPLVAGFFLLLCVVAENVVRAIVALRSGKNIEEEVP